MASYWCLQLLFFSGSRFTSPKKEKYYLFIYEVITWGKKKGAEH